LGKGKEEVKVANSKGSASVNHGGDVRAGTVIALLVTKLKPDMGEFAIDGNAEAGLGVLGRHQHKHKAVAVIRGIVVATRGGVRAGAATRTQTRRKVSVSSRVVEDSVENLFAFSGGHVCEHGHVASGSIARVLAVSVTTVTATRVPRVPAPIRPIRLKATARAHCGDRGFVLKGLGKDVREMGLRAENIAIPVIPLATGTVTAKAVAHHKARGTARDGNGTTAIGALRTGQCALSLRG